MNDIELYELNQDGSPPLYFERDIVVNNKHHYDRIKIANLIIVILILLINLIIIGVSAWIYLSWSPDIKELYTSASDILHKWSDGYTKIDKMVNGIQSDWGDIYQQATVLFNKMNDEWDTGYTNATSLLDQMESDWTNISKKINAIIKNFNSKPGFG